ncbi:nucleoside hydrolase [Solirubrobacter phytolaccae]|uniref:Nucleoside hydrolase n=1 Tax=Solirubrobacter phytolaccae TaxID=1404360 RepID=A0A9X3N681_9ACTN|nr:nucleoside hydrolase [Solirubrobacter phytolaccae]MDA0180523.1 nucleoside hydrolase [Solirubrobacter phytolaccae]
MRSTWVCALVAAFALVAPSTASADVPSIIIDTDIALWWDDVSAFAIANAAEDKGDVRYLGAVADVKSLSAAPAIDAINTWYGNGKVPVGATLGVEQNIFANVYTSDLARRFKHSLGDGTSAEDAVALYRRLLSGEPDHSVTIVSLGGLTNLAALLSSDRALVERKVKNLVVMAGEFPTPSRAWTNELIDVPATKYVFNTAWPKSVPITWADAKIGFPLFVGQTVSQAHPASSPVRAAFEILFPDGTVGDANWDAIAIYYAIYGLGDDLLRLTGAGGAARVDSWGAISWVDNPERPDDRYLQIPSYPRFASVLNALIDYVPAHPGGDDETEVSAASDVGGEVPATLGITTGAPASFAPFVPGVARDYDTSLDVTVTSSAADAALTVADPSPTAPGHLVNGTLALPQALKARAGAAAFADVAASPTRLAAWTGPVASAVVQVDFRQPIGATDALRTGRYSKTLTLTLSTTTP